jgi:glycosyltransferase involved in cell wall biosynthesis
MNKLRSGLQRVEREIAAGLRKLDPGSQYFIFVAWNSESHRFHLVHLDHLIEREKLPPFQSWLASCPPVDLSERADLFILGSNWPLGESYHNDVVALALKGLRVSVLIPDLIPIRHRRDFYTDCPDGTTCDLFKVFCIKVLPVCSNVLTISNYVRTDIEKLFEEIGLEASEKRHVPKLYVLKLGADWSTPIVDSLNTALPKTGPIKNRYILCVSTLEKRKNHKRLLEAMRRVRDQIKDLDLVLVGRTDTSMEEATLEFIRESAWVHHFDRVDDSTLRRLYEESLFTVYPSLDEGYGLPVIESLRHGKFCLASQAGAIPEAGEEWADYFDPEDVQDLAAKILKYVANPEELRRREILLASYRPVSWRETSWQVAGVFYEDRAKDMFMTGDMHEPARPRMQETSRRKAAVSKHEGLDIANAASLQMSAQSELDEIMDNLRHRIVKELDLFVAAQETKPRNQLELSVIAEGLGYDCGIYDVNALRRVPEEEFFEALSVLLFKRPLQENRPLSAVKQISRRRLMVLWMCSLLPGRRARIVGLYRQLLRSALSKSPFVFSLAKRVYYRIT